MIAPKQILIESNKTTTKNINEKMDKQLQKNFKNMIT